MAGSTRFLYTSFDSTVPSTSDIPQYSSFTTSPDTTTSSTDSSSSSRSPVNNPLLRRVHTKSRRGCLNCKRRRIKCPENHPECTQCAKRGLQCEWPEIQIEQTGNDGKRITRAIPPQVTSPNTFTIQDFRLFNHFIQDCHPYHPLGNEDRWKHDIPSIAHNHDYLLHAMLGLAASDLAEGSPTDTALVMSGMNHRVRAIESLSAALARGVHTMEEGNAMLATCYTLVFQSALISDGFPEYMSFIRGCLVVAWQMGVKQLTFLFSNILNDDQLVKMGPYLTESSSVDPVLTGAALASLEACGPLVVKNAERSFYQCLVEIAEAACISNRQAYMGIMKIYGIFAYHMSAADFHQFINPNNQVGLLLQAHMIAIQTILDPVLSPEQNHTEMKLDKPNKPRHTGSVGWLDSIDKNVTEEMRPLFAWPLARGKQLKEEIAERILRHQQGIQEVF